jgi:hypothetical protein
LLKFIWPNLLLSLLWGKGEGEDGVILEGDQIEAEDFEVEMVGIEEVTEIENEVDHLSVQIEAQTICQLMKGVEMIVLQMGSIAEEIYIVETSIAEIIDLTNKFLILLIEIPGVFEKL